MFDIILSNYGLWFNLLIPFGIGLYLVLTNREYILKEFAIQLIATIVFLLGMYTLLFSTTTDLIDHEYWNGKVSKFEYFEKWTEEETYTEEECSGSGKNRSCRTVTKTREVYHPPYWQITTSNGEIISINRDKYRRAANEFGQTFKNITRFNQVSFGDGNKYVSVPTKVIPTAVKHMYSNYVVAAKDNVINVSSSTEEIQPYIKNGSLRKYPSHYVSTYGETKLGRVIDTTGMADYKSLLSGLDLISYKYGFYKQVNPIIYITSEGRSFKRLLKYYWNGGKKNDAILILGVDKSSKNIVWSDVITYTNNTDFIVDCQSFFEGTSISNTGKILKDIDKLISVGYKRKPMEEFSYLKENISLDWYWQLLVLVLNILLSGFIFLKFLDKNIPFVNNFRFNSKRIDIGRFNSRRRW